jgi:hypothetical protein
MALEGCTRLTELDIGGNDLSVTTFFPCLIANRGLRRLSLSVIRDQRFIHLSDRLYTLFCQCTPLLSVCTRTPEATRDCVSPQGCFGQPRTAVQTVSALLLADRLRHPHEGIARVLSTGAWMASESCLGDPRVVEWVWLYRGQGSDRPYRPRGRSAF